MVLLLALLVGADNLPIVRDFARSFDKVEFSCQAPCTDIVGQ